MQTNKPETDAGAMLLPAQAARQLHVSTKTLGRMADKGDVSVLKLPSGHRRYYQTDVDRLVAGRS